MGIRSLWRTALGGPLPHYRGIVSSSCAFAGVAIHSASGIIAAFDPKRKGGGPYPTANLVMSVIAFIGTLRFRDHRSIPEIHQALRDRGVPIAERTVTHLRKPVRGTGGTPPF